IPLEKIVFAQYPSTFGGGGVVPNRAAGNVLIDAIKTDRPVVVAGGTGPGSVVDDTKKPEPSPSPSTLPSASASPSASPSASAPPPVTAVTLPPQITGQSAAQTTCSSGQTAGG